MHQVHGTFKETASGTHEKNQVMCHSWHSIGAACFCCHVPSVLSLCSGSSLVSLAAPQASAAHRSSCVCQTAGQASREALSWLLGMWNVAPHLLTQLGLALPFSIPNTVCKAAWQLHIIAASDFRLCGNVLAIKEASSRVWEWIFIARLWFLFVWIVSLHERM